MNTKRPRALRSLCITTKEIIKNKQGLTESQSTLFIITTLTPALVGLALIAVKMRSLLEFFTGLAFLLPCVAAITAGIGIIRRHGKMEKKLQDLLNAGQNNSKSVTVYDGTDKFYFDISAFLLYLAIVSYFFSGSCAGPVGIGYVAFSAPSILAVALLRLMGKSISRHETNIILVELLTIWLGIIIITTARGFDWGAACVKLS